MPIKVSVPRLVGNPPRLSPDGVDAVARDFVRKGSSNGGSGAIDALPAHAGGVTPERLWIAPIYGAGSYHLTLIRAALDRQRVLGGTVHLSCLGDSKTMGTGTEGGAGTQSWPAVLRRALGAREGFIPACIDDNIWDDRWTATGMTTPGSDYAGVVPDTGGTSTTLGVTVSTPHTGGTLWVAAPSGGSATVTVDGTPTTVTLAATPDLQPVTVDALTDDAHDWSWDLTDVTHVPGFTPLHPADSVVVHRIARGGAKASGWLPGAGTGGGLVGLWDTFRSVVPAADAVLAQLGTNNPGDTASIASFWSAVAALDTPAIVIAPGQLDVDAAFEGMWQAVWQAAIDHDMPLIDNQSIVGTRTYAIANGWGYNTHHEGPGGYAMEGMAVARAITGGLT